MKALRFRAYGPVANLAWQEVDVPECGADEALVEVHAAAVTRFDVASVSGAFPGRLPGTPGRDFAGVVLQGAGWEGKSVWGTGPDFGASRDGAHAEQVIVPVSALSEKPRNLSMAESAAVGIPHFAAFKSLVQVAQVNAGEIVLITGADGAVGRVATQIARGEGAKVIGADIVDGNGATDWWLNLNETDLLREVRRITGAQGVDVVLDAVGADLFEPCLESVRKGGRHVAIASSLTNRVSFNLSHLLRKELRLMGVSTIDMSGPELAALRDELRILFENGAVPPPELDVAAFAEALQVYERVAARQTGRTQVLQWDDLSR